MATTTYAAPGSRPGGSRRPGAAAQSAAPGAAPAAPVAGRRAAGEGRRRPRLTGRAAILVLVLAVLAVSYASSMRAYLQQRSHIDDLKAQIAQREADIDELEREKRRWHDPAYVEAQARDRFGYVMPGETSYVVLDEDGEPLESDRRCPTPTTVTAARPTAVVTSGVELGGARRHPAEGPRRRVDVIDRRRDGAEEQRCSDRARRRGGDRAQLGREPRAIHEVGHRCPCGNPDVVTTEPRLPNGTPFPTTYYLTCPRAASRIGTLEGSGLMKEMQDRLGERPRPGGGVPPRRTSATSRPAPRSPRARAERARDRGDLRRRDARPGEVPARAGRPVARPGPRREPARRRGARPARRLVVRRPVRHGGDAATSLSVVAAIDCGTNTIKLLIGDLPDVAVRESRMVRLGQGVDRTGRLADEALARAFAAIDEYAALIREHDVRRRIRFCATSATRDATNGDVFAAGVRERLGVSPEVITGAEEAALAFDGAIRQPAHDAGGAGAGRSTSAAAPPS